MTAETGTYRWMAPEVCLSSFSFFLPFEIFLSFISIGIFNALFSFLFCLVLYYLS
jgi:hypothetical protein